MNNFKKRGIKKMKFRSIDLECKINCLPKGIICPYRGLNHSEICQHEKNHKYSIMTGKRNKSRYWEITYKENLEIEREFNNEKNFGKKSRTIKAVDIQGVQNLEQENVRLLRDLLIFQGKEKLISHSLKLKLQKKLKYQKKTYKCTSDVLIQ